MLLESFSKRSCLLNVLLAFVPAIKKRRRIDLLRKGGVDVLDGRLKLLLLLRVPHTEDERLLYRWID